MEEFFSEIFESFNEEGWSTSDNEEMADILKKDIKKRSIEAERNREGIERLLLRYLTVVQTEQLEELTFEYVQFKTPQIFVQFLDELGVEYERCRSLEKGIYSGSYIIKFPGRFSIYPLQTGEEYNYQYIILQPFGGEKTCRRMLNEYSLGTYMVFFRKSFTINERNNESPSFQYINIPCKGKDITGFPSTVIYDLSIVFKTIWDKFKKEEYR